MILKQKECQESKIKASEKHNKKIKPRSGCTAHSDIIPCLLVKLFHDSGFLPPSKQISSSIYKVKLILFIVILYWF